MIAIIDYGMGNLQSVSSAVERLGFVARITADEAEIASADAAILPGVGAFGDAIRNLQQTGLDQAVKRFAASGKPLLGICLGMQLLFSESEEYGHHKGLQLLPGKVIKFAGEFKIPHIGWNRLQLHRQGLPLFEGIADGEDFVYFVHSFHVLPERSDDLLATTDYYGQVTAITGRNNVTGMQFHPEKSGAAGMQLLRNFLNETKKQ